MEIPTTWPQPWREHTAAQFNREMVKNVIERTKGWATLERLEGERVDIITWACLSSFASAERPNLT